MGNKSFPMELAAIYTPITDKTKYAINPRKSISDCLIQRPRKRQEENISKINSNGRRVNNLLMMRMPKVTYDRKNNFTKTEMFQNCITSLDHSKTLGCLGQVAKKINPSLQTHHVKYDCNKRTKVSTIPKRTQQCLDPLHVSSLSYDASFSESISENVASLSERTRKSDTTCITGENSFSKSMNQRIYETFMLDKMNESSYTGRTIDNFYSTSVESIDDLLKTDSNVYRPKTLSSKSLEYCSSDLLFLEDIPTYDENRINKHFPAQHGKQSFAINHSTYVKDREKVYPKHNGMSPNGFQEHPYLDKNTDKNPKQNLSRKKEEEGIINQTQYSDKHWKTLEKPVVSQPNMLLEQSFHPQTNYAQKSSGSKMPKGVRNNKSLPNPIVPQRPTCLELPREPQLPTCIQTPAVFPITNVLYPTSFQKPSCATNPVLFNKTSSLQKMTSGEQHIQNPNIQQPQNFYPPPTSTSKDLSNNVVQSVDFQDFLQQKPCFGNESGNNSHSICQNHTMLEDNSNQNILHSPYCLSGLSKDPHKFDSIQFSAGQTHCEDVKQPVLIPSDSSTKKKNICNADEEVQTSDVSVFPSSTAEEQSRSDRSPPLEISPDTESTRTLSVNLSCRESPKGELVSMVKNSVELENPYVSMKKLAEKESSQIQTSNSLLSHLMERDKPQVPKATANFQIQVEEGTFPNAKSEQLLKSKLSSDKHLNMTRNFESKDRFHKLQQTNDGNKLQSNYSSNVMEENNNSSKGNEVCRTEQKEGILFSPIPWKSSETLYPAETHYLEIKIPLRMKQAMNFHQTIKSQCESDTRISEKQVSTVKEVSTAELNKDATVCHEEHKPQICNRSLMRDKLDPSRHYSSVNQPIVIYHKVIPALTDSPCNRTTCSEPRCVAQKKKRLNVSFKECSNEEHVKEDIALPQNGTKNTGSDSTIIYEMSSQSQSVINCHMIKTSYDGKNCPPEIQVLHDAANKSFSLQENSDYDSNELITLKLNQGDVLLKNDEVELKNENIRDIFLKEDYCEIISIDSNDILHKSSYLKAAKKADSVNSSSPKKQSGICEKDESLRTRNLISALVGKCNTENEEKTGRQIFDGHNLNTVSLNTEIVDNDCSTYSAYCPQSSKEQISMSDSNQKNITDKQKCLLQYFKCQPAWLENVVSKVTQDLLKKIKIKSNTSISMCQSYTIPLHTLPEEQSRPTTVQMLTEGSTPTIHTLPNGATCKTSASNVCVMPAGSKHVKKSCSDTSQMAGQNSPHKYLLLDHVIPQRMAGNKNEYSDDSSTTTLRIFQQSLAHTPVPASPPTYTIMPCVKNPSGVYKSKGENRASSTKSTQYSMMSSEREDDLPIVICGCQYDVELEKPRQDSRQDRTIEESRQDRTIEDSRQDRTIEDSRQDWTIEESRQDWTIEESLQDSVHPEVEQEVRNDISVPPTIFGQHTESTIGNMQEPPPEEEFNPSHIFDIIFSRVIPSQPGPCPPGPSPQSYGVDESLRSSYSPPCHIAPIPYEDQGTIHEQEQYIRPPDTGPVETTYYPSADQPLRRRLRKEQPRNKGQKERPRATKEFIDSSGAKRVRYFCRRGGACVGKPATLAPNIFARKPESTVGVMPYIPIIKSLKRRFCRYCTLEICPGEEVSRERRATRSGVQMVEKELVSTMLDVNPYKRTRCTLDNYSSWEFPVEK